MAIGRGETQGYTATGQVTAGVGEDERRQDARFEVGVRGALAVLDGPEDDGHAAVLVHDVSRQGLRLSTRSELKPGDRAMVRFGVPGAPPRTRTVAIRWVKRVGGTFEAGAEADDWTSPREARAIPSPPPDEGYFEAEGEFIDAETSLDGVPVPAVPTHVAAAYQEPQDGPALPPAVVPRPALKQAERAQRLHDVRFAAQVMNRGWLEIVAVLAVGLATGSILWLALRWDELLRP